MSNEELVIRIKALGNTGGSEQAGIDMAQLYEQNRAFIEKLAKRYEGATDIEDLEQEGYFGLCAAVENYDPGQGVKFLTYASHWIKQAMVRYIENNSRTVRISSGQYQRMQRYKQLQSRFMMMAGREPTVREIARNMRISEKQAADLQEQIHKYTMDTLDRQTSGEDASEVRDTVADSCCLEEKVIGQVAAEELQRRLWEQVNSLPENESQAIRYRYQEQCTLADAGRKMGVTVEMIRQYQNRGMRKLRSKKQIRQLGKDYDIIHTRAYSGGVESFRRTWTSSTEYAALKLMEE